MLPVRFSPPNIINTNSLIYKINFPITFFLAKTFREMSMKCLLFNFFIPYKIPMRASIIIKSTSKFFSAPCVLLMAGFTSKISTTFLEAQFKFCGRMEYMRSVDDDSKWCVLVICFQISHLRLLQRSQKPFSVLGEGTLALTRMSIKLFSFKNLSLQHSQKFFYVPYPVLEKDEF